MHWSEPTPQETTLHLSNYEAHYIHFKEWRLCLSAAVRIAAQNVHASQYVHPEGDKNRFTSSQLLEMDKWIGLLGDAEEALERYDGVNLGFTRRFLHEEAAVRAAEEQASDDLYDAAKLDGITLDPHHNPIFTEHEKIAS